MTPARRGSSWSFVLERYTEIVDEARRSMPQVPERIKFEARRKLVHVGASLAGVVVFLLLPFGWAIAFACFVIAVISLAHFVRRKRLKVAPALEKATEPIGDLLDQTRRPHEDYPWAPVSFTLALMVVAAAVTFAGIPRSFAFAAFGILGVGDAASALIGVAYGKHKLPWNRRKSWEGTSAGALAGYLAALVFAGVDHAVRGEVLPFAWLALGGVGALAGAGAETFPNVEDNFVVPLAALAAMVLAGMGLGVLVL